MARQRLLTIFMAVIWLSGCFYDPPFSQLSCTVDQDCTGDAVCRAGACVLPDAADMGSDTDTDRDDSVPVVITRVTVTPDVSDLTLGNRLQLQAQAFDADDNEVADATFVWSSADEAVATVDATGAVDGIGPGTAQISATADDAVGSATITVLAPVDSVTVEPAMVTLGQGLSQLLVAHAFDANGMELQGRTVTWTSSDDAVAEVVEDGTVTALAVGEATITADIEGKTAASVVTVQDNPVATVTIEPDEPIVVLEEIKTFEAVIRDADDNVLDPRNRTFTWQLSNMATATLIQFNVPSKRRIQGRQVGTATLSVDVEMGMATDDLELEVILPIIDKVTIMDPGIVPVGSTRQLQTVVTDPDGNALTGRMHAWSSSDTDVGTVDPATGLFTAVAPGTTTITVDVEGVMGMIDVEVQFLLAQVSAGGRHTCGVSPDGIALCWGDDRDEALGNGAAGDTDTPMVVSGSFAYTDIAAGGAATCALESSGGVQCWGAPGLTGVADGSGSDIPRAIDGGRLYVALAVGDAHACAIDDAGEVWCWGSGADGRLGNNDTADADAPVQVQFTPVGTPTALALGANHSCVLTDTPKIWCWGDGADGALGQGTTDSSSVPAEVSSAVAFAEVTAGDQFTCARTAANAVYCWGTNGEGQLGLGDLGTTHADVPTVLPAVAMTAIDAGASHGCGLDAVAGEVRCWGRPNNFRLGNMDDATVADAPVPNSANLNAVSVSSGDQHSCAIAVDGRPYCWGSNGGGRSGTGGGGSLEQPTLVWP